MDDEHTARVVVGLAALGRAVAGTGSGMVAAGRGCVRRWLGGYMAIVPGLSISLPDLSVPS